MPKKTDRAIALELIQKLARIAAADDNGNVQCVSCGDWGHWKGLQEALYKTRSINQMLRKAPSEIHHVITNHFAQNFNGLYVPFPNKEDLKNGSTVEGLCVTVTPTEYIYTGGQESGVIVELINYPRFPSHPQEIYEHAIDLAEELRAECCQQSYTIMMPDHTYYDTLREE